MTGMLLDVLLAAMVAGLGEGRFLEAGFGFWCVEMCEGEGKRV